jgi:molybdate transport system ATP-binding protein
MDGPLLIDIHKQFGRRGREGSGPVISAALSLGLAPVSVLFGPSGCGKTTVLRCIAGVESPTRGTISAYGETWFDSRGGVNIPPQRRGIGYVFQEQALFPHLTARANIAYGLPRGSSARIDEMVDLLGVRDIQHRRPSQLSGGQRQRIALARALAPAPRLLLLDEPFASLDAPCRQQLRADLRALLLHTGTPALLVTHDRAEALALGDEIAVMVGSGHTSVRQSGPVDAVFSRPVDHEVAACVGMDSVLPAHIAGTSEGLSEVSVGGQTLTAVNPHSHAGHVLICIRGEDVTLRRGPAPSESSESVRNRLSARIESIASEGPLARVFLDCGFRLTALVTRRACKDLGLVPGANITALIKASSIHIIPRDVAGRPGAAAVQSAHAPEEPAARAAPRDHARLGV